MSNCPARAGFTSATNGCAVRTRDHPRSRGVYSVVMSRVAPFSGSSPLARGLQEVPVADRTVVGIIPARAGFTHLHEADDQPVQDHPRSRGVYAIVCAVLSSLYGSSPLARGLQQRRRRRVTGSGIIPARAGFTIWATVAAFIVMDHPRSRGVYREATCPRRLQEGSSPLARGLRGRQSGPGPASTDHPRSRGVYLFLVVVHPLAERIIPARAGFTSRRESGNRTRRDHPRSRGVYLNWTAAGLKGKGSSPLARGLPVDTESPTITAPDHPRSRGVYMLKGTSLGLPLGSSPLARGLLRA